MSHQPFLRDSPTRAHYLSLVDLLSAVRSSANDQDRARSAGQLGEHYRIIRHPKAVETLEDAVALSAGTLRVANRLRLATARFYVGSHAEALAELRALRKDVEPELADYVVLHLGKCLAELGAYEDAADCFEEALTIRQQRDADVSLLESSRTAAELAIRLTKRVAPAARQDQHGDDADWLLRWHNNTPGSTPRAFLPGVDDSGRSSFGRLVDVCAGETVLDLACGDGTLLEMLAHENTDWNLSGIDMSDGELRLARGRLSGHDVSLVQGQVQSLPFDDGRFDSVLCHLALMLFADVDQVLAEVARVVRPGGLFAAIVGGRTPQEPGNAWLTLVELLREVEFEHPVHIINVAIMQPGGADRLLGTAGFEEVNVAQVGLRFDATPADVWTHFMSSYDPAQMGERNVAELHERFFCQTSLALDANGRVPMVKGLQLITARRAEAP